MDWKNLYLSADGRIGKKEFWIGWIVLFAVGIVANLIPLINMIAGFVLIYPTVCVYSKRLHDSGKTGWLAALPYAVFIVAMVIGIAMFGTGIFAAAMSGSSGNDPAAAAAAMSGMGGFFGVMGLAFLFYIAFTLWVGLSNGDPGENRYGPPPGGAGGAAPSV